MTTLTLGAPASGFVHFAALLARAGRPNTLAYKMEDRDGRDVSRFFGDHATFVVVNRDAALCREITLSMSTDVRERWDARNPDNPDSWRFDAACYTYPLTRQFNVRIPTKPLGGIFFTMADGKLVMSIAWEHMDAILPIIVHVLQVDIDVYAARAWLHNTNATELADTMREYYNPNQSLTYPL